jgi:hypothetical protein
MSTVELPVARHFVSGHSTGMQLPAVHKRILKRLKATGQTANGASEAAGKPDAIRNLKRAVEEGARTGISTATLAALAPVLKTTPEWLMSGIGREDTETDEEATIPIWGRAGAGGLVIGFNDGAGPIGAIPRPEDVADTFGAVEIEGNSLGSVFNGWYALYDDVRHPPTEDLIGQLCVLQLSDGRVFIKELAKGRGKRFSLVSSFDAPIYDVVVAWAAPVKRVVPR